MKSGNLNFLEPPGPLQDCNGTAFGERYDLHRCRLDWSWCNGHEWRTQCQGVTDTSVWRLVICQFFVCLNLMFQNCLLFNLCACNNISYNTWFLKDKSIKHLTDELINDMEQSNSWKTNKFSDSQEIPLILWNPKVHYRIHNSPPPAPILRQINPGRVHRMHTACSPAPQDTSQHTKSWKPYAVICGLALLKMGIMMPETCCDNGLLLINHNSCIKLVSHVISY